MGRQAIRKTSLDCDYCGQCKLQLVLNDVGYSLFSFYCNRCKFEWEVYTDTHGKLLKPKLNIREDVDVAIDELRDETVYKLGFKSREDAWNRCMELMGELP